MSQKRRRRTEDELQRFFFQRALYHLSHIRPNVPIPFAFLDQVLGVDMYIEDPPAYTEVEEMTPEGQRDVKFVFTSPDPLDIEPEELFEITGPDFERAVVTVSDVQRVQIQSLIEEIKRSGKWVEHGLEEEPAIALAVGLYHFVDNPEDEIAPDHLALLAAHGLYWLEWSLEIEDAYAALEVSVALWLLVLREALAPAEATPFLQPVFNLVERYAPKWPKADAAPVEFLALWGAAIAEFGDPELQPWVERIFALGYHLIKRLSDEAMIEADVALFRARERAGLWP
jgi:hypothetical protein